MPFLLYCIAFFLFSSRLLRIARLVIEAPSLPRLQVRVPAVQPQDPPCAAPAVQAASCLWIRFSTSDRLITRKLVGFFFLPTPVHFLILVCSRNLDSTRTRFRYNKSCLSYTDYHREIYLH
ncbi:hypothetical protein EDB81DRAFT_798825 [Dactylonectria macrodidyma]|uniref:Secreted protein n=1 Tax=Dactylonectria macrodidyma TaxID=307937 RepID=A0A9P9EP71_9HYPO|nr:hypothetical protein EDB81DRAFT_798825 [Dactylonectria macrodidyma]